MKAFIISLILIAGGIILSFNSCRHTPFIPDMPQVSFSKDVYPIIIGNCTQSGCHDQGRRDNEGFSFSSYDDVINFGEVIPGNAGKSRLYKTLIGRGRLMPPNKQLLDEQILTIYLWIEQGAQNN